MCGEKKAGGARRMVVKKGKLYRNKKTKKVYISEGNIKNQNKSDQKKTFEEQICQM